MPLCDTRCTKCGHEEEIFVKFHEKHNEKCNACGKKGVERLISGGCHAFVKDVKSIGQLAEQNVKKKGKYWEGDAQDRENREKEVRIDSLGRPNIRHKYKDAELDNSLLEATYEEKKRYVLEGKKPAKKNKKTKKEIIAEIKERKKIK